MKKILSILFALLWVISLNAQVLTIYKSGRVLYCTAYTDSIVVTRAIPNAATESAFAISDNSYVCFSPGNLQYHIATDTWRFADYQYDYVAADITDTTYTGWIDLFGWGTGNNPTNVEDANSKFTDWGTNAIGTDVANTWRTLTIDEWLYLFQHTHWTIAKVNGTLGFMLLPDSFETPVGLSVSILGDGNLTDASKNYSESDYSTNIYNSDEFVSLESAGAIFLPAAGARYGTILSACGQKGTYWTATTGTSKYAARYMSFTDTKALVSVNNHAGRKYGYSVRLVRDL